MCNNCGCNADPFAFNAEKKNCGCGQDPCVTYGAESLEDLDKSQLIDLIKNLEDRDEYVKGYVENAAEVLNNETNIQFDTDAYEDMTWETPSDELEDAVENLLVEVKRLRKAIAEDMDGRVVNVVGGGDKVYVTIRFPDSDKIFVGDMEDVMLAESFGAEDIDDYIQRIFTFIDEKVGTEYFGSIEDEEEVIRFKQAFMDKFNEIEEPPIIDWNEILSAESFGAESKKCSFCKTTDVKNFSQGWDDYCMACARRHLKDYYAESFSAESGQMCGVCFGNDDLPYDSDHFTDCRRCGKSVCIDCDGEMEYHPDWFKVCGECDNILENVSIHGAESFGAEYGKRQRFGNRYIGRDTKGRIISNVSVGRSLKADRRTKSKTPARSGFGHKGDTQKGASGGFKLPTDAKSVIGIGAVLGGLWAYLESKA